ncbi:hypothetical protein DV515_00013652 [Chloebia gouldiae]|uniref:Uncharacterized protein n=1 Tax=Chloebia gouldiae TaxID=44316 RepID=A0A3L8S1P7_CHLGU|nr:hypothetical protein DV515_00013652 [Chloebia gouldiae]
MLRLVIGALSNSLLSPGEARGNNFYSARVWLMNAKGTIAKVFVIFTENSEELFQALVCSIEQLLELLLQQQA